MQIDKFNITFHPLSSFKINQNIDFEWINQKAIRWTNLCWIKYDWNLNLSFSKIWSSMLTKVDDGNTHDAYLWNVLLVYFTPRSLKKSFWYHPLSYCFAFLHDEIPRDGIILLPPALFSTRRFTPHVVIVPFTFLWRHLHFSSCKLKQFVESCQQFVPFETN